MDNNAPHWYGETAQCISLVGMMMAIFMLVACESPIEKPEPSA